MKTLYTAAMLTFLTMSSGLVFGQADDSLDSVDELVRARALLSARQDQFGAMDVSLIEPLEQLADQLIELRQFDEAHSMLDRAMQIARIEGGLYTEFQRPLLEKKIENYANRSDWDGARVSMNHLLWLYTNKSVKINEALIDDLMELSRVHLRAVAEDDVLFQGEHFRKSLQIKWLAIGVGETLWGPADERLVPIIYEQLSQLHLQTVALWAGGPTSYVLRQVAPGSEIMRVRTDVEEGFYLTGLGLINKLFTIYAQNESPSPEALAMVNVYLADWHILFDQPAEATATYSQAYQEFVTAGVDSDLLFEFFDKPQVIPDTEFYPSVEAAVTAHRAKMVTPQDESDNSYLSFNEWSAALPNVRNPIPDFSSEARSVDSNFALFSFSLAGVNKVSRWYSHRFSSTVNMIEQAELLSHYFDPASEQELELLEKLNSLTFRPRIVDGEPRQASGILKYHLASD